MVVPFSLIRELIEGRSIHTFYFPKKLPQIKLNFIFPGYVSSWLVRPFSPEPGRAFSCLWLLASSSQSTTKSWAFSLSNGSSVPCVLSILVANSWSRPPHQGPLKWHFCLHSVTSSVTLWSHNCSIWITLHCFQYYARSPQTLPTAFSLCLPLPPCPAVKLYPQFS